MKRILLMILFTGVLLSSIFAQDVKYRDYLNRNNLSIADKDITVIDSTNLLNHCKIKFSQNKSLVFADLITKDSIVPIWSADLDNTPHRWLGGLCADFDSCFFWGNKISGNIYGKIFYKDYPYFRLDNFYIYVDRNIEQSILILADPNYEDNIQSLFVFNVKNNTFIFYILKKEISPEDLKYIKYVNITGDTITLKNIDNNKLLYGIKKDN